MADEPYNVNIETKAQLAEIQKLLEKLRAINAEISKINGQTFSAVSGSAAELSKTGKNLAKALVSQRIASEKLNEIIGGTGNEFDNARNKTKNFKNEVDGTKNSITGFYMELGAMGARMATHLPSAVAKTIQAFGEQEVALNKLAAAIRSHGGKVAETLPIMQNFASEIQRIVTYGDEQVLAMQAMATSMGVNADQMDGVIRSAIGLASALGMDVATATKAASAAIQGKTTMLQEYIPSLSKCKTEEEKLAKVQELSANGFSQAEAAAETLNGKLKAADLEKSKSVQRGLEYDILKTRASGNESLAKEREGKLRIAQLSAEIFENTRKEGMSRKELETLHQSANKQAQDRYNLEKSVTDEVERQNLAKDAQAKIEDILITNKIEQLKAEGKLTAAKELEREREIKRTLAGMKGLSGDDKKIVEKALRQTNEYRDKQEKNRKEKSAKSGSASVSKGSFPSSNDGVMSIGGTSRGTGRPATVSKKSAALYDEWKAAGGSNSGTSWSDFRREKSQPDNKKKLQSQARGLLDVIEAQAKGIGGRVTLKGAVESASNTAEKSATASTRIQPAKLGQTQSKKAASPAINNKLDAMGAGGESKGSEDTQAQSLGQIATAVTAMGEDIKSLKTTVTALAEKKKG